MEKIAAIDIGSNAIRFTTAIARAGGEIVLDKKVRIPLRLGTHAFSDNQSFSDSFIHYAQTVFSEIRKTLNTLEVRRCRTIATSALRDAKNRDEFRRSIMEASGIRINTISGEREAKLILNAIENEIQFEGSRDYLLFDLGGGSLELSAIKNGKVLGSESFNLGTVRLFESIKQFESEAEVNDWLGPKISKIQSFITEQIPNSPGIQVIGTGGNFRRLVKLRGIVFDKKTNYIPMDEVNVILNKLEKTPYLDRIKHFDLRPDRADIIIPALKVITRVLSGFPIEKIVAPDVGLLHGILLDMCHGQTDEDQVF
jgi:exopolyphosphatase/guanosine-5'-triphosphate,3'-diphosphate pyrophosphatase